MFAKKELWTKMILIFYCIMVNSPQALQCPGNSHLRVVDLQSASIYYQHLDQLKALMQPMRKMIEIAGICFCCVLLLCNCWIDVQAEKIFLQLQTTMDPAEYSSTIDVQAINAQEHQHGIRCHTGLIN